MEIIQKSDQKKEKYEPEEGTRLKTPEEQLSEKETSNLHEKDFRVMLVRMIQDLRGKEITRGKSRNYEKLKKKKRKKI